MLILSSLFLILNIIINGSSSSCDIWRLVDCNKKLTELPLPSGEITKKLEQINNFCKTFDRCEHIFINCVDEKHQHRLKISVNYCKLFFRLRKEDLNDCLIKLEEEEENGRFCENFKFDDCKDWNTLVYHIHHKINKFCTKNQIEIFTQIYNNFLCQM
ncbi:unnamed protein product [Caenorhabditis angaria]|uniref:DUF19 domain-containing protein n=1 Tax=Caenorhabditis angaria TaxID=860376 RepID=A0A9P1N945_9PELO|nr:unnamed protein product [Caenorhabditis angaria]